MSLLCMDEKGKVKSRCRRSQVSRRTVWLFHSCLIQMNTNVRCQSHINWWLIITILQGRQLWKDRALRYNLQVISSCSLSSGNGAMHHQCEIRVHWSRQHVFQLQIEYNSHQYALVIFFLSIWIGSFIFVNMAYSWLLFLAFGNNTSFAVCSGYKRNRNAMM